MAGRDVWDDERPQRCGLLVNDVTIGKRITMNSLIDLVNDVTIGKQITSGKLDYQE